MTLKSSSAGVECWRARQAHGQAGIPGSPVWPLVAGVGELGALLSSPLVPHLLFPEHSWGLCLCSSHCLRGSSFSLMS